MKHLTFFLSILCVGLLPLVSQSQCKSFAKMTKENLKPYVHDGALNAINLKTGQNAKIHKTFYSGQHYRIMIAAADNLPPIEIEITDMAGNVLYVNKSAERTKTWDVNFDGTQRLIISLTIPQKNDNTLESGCVTALFGFLTAQQFADSFQK